MDYFVGTIDPEFVSGKPSAQEGLLDEIVHGA